MTGKIPNKFLDRITTTLGSVAALAWNEAIQLLFRQLLGESGGALTTKLLLRLYSYAVIVIFVPIAVSQTAERAKKPEEEQNKGLIDLSRSEN